MTPQPSPIPTVRRPRIYYGWWIVLGALIAQFVAIGSQSPVAGAFLVPMTEDLGWDRAEFTIAVSLATAVSAVFGFFVGGYVDRFGARPLMLVGSVILGASLVSISLVETLWQFILLRGVAFTLGFVLIGNLVVNVTISKWFVEKRGWAISIGSLGVSAGSVILTPIMVRVVDTFGWRDGWVVLGVGAFVLMFPVALMMRRQPEDYGLLPDGAQGGDSAGEVASRARVAADFDNSFTRAQAVRTPAMWLLVAAFGFSSVGLVSLLFHAIPFLTDNDFPRSHAALFFSMQGLAALLSKFVWGWSMQRYPARLLAAGSFVCAGAGAALMVMAGQETSRPLMLLAFVLFGAGIGGQIPLNEFIWANFFGRRYLGSVRAAAMPVTILFSAGGPYFASVYFDVVGSYNGAILTFAGLWMIAAVLVLLTRPPRLPGSESLSARIGVPDPETPLAAVAAGMPAAPVAAGEKPSMRAEPVDEVERPTLHHVAAFGLPPEPTPTPRPAVDDLAPTEAPGVPVQSAPVPPWRPASAPQPEPAPVPAAAPRAAGIVAPPPRSKAPSVPPAAIVAGLPRFTRGDDAEIIEGGWGRWGGAAASVRPEVARPEAARSVVDERPVAEERPVVEERFTPESSRTAADDPPRVAKPRVVMVRRNTLPARLGDPGSFEITLGDAVRIIRERPVVGAGAAAAAVAVAWLVARHGKG